MRANLERLFNSRAEALVKVYERYGRDGYVSTMDRNELMGIVFSMASLNLISDKEFDGLNYSLHACGFAK